MLERTILSSLIFNEPYVRKVLPYLQKEYFQNHSEAGIFDLINSHIQKYNKLPSVATITMELSSRKSDINEFEYKELIAITESLKKEDWEMVWLLDQTEKWIKEKAVYGAILKSVGILKDKTGKTTTGARSAER